MVKEFGGSKIHPAFDVPRTRVEFVRRFMDESDQIMGHTQKICDALVYFREKLWELEDNVERAIDAWTEYDEEHDRETEDLKERLEDSDYRDEQEKRVLEGRLREIFSQSDALYAKYTKMRDEVAELKRRGASLEQLNEQMMTQATEYLEHLSALLKISSLAPSLHDEQ